MIDTHSTTRPGQPSARRRRSAWTQALKNALPSALIMAGGAAAEPWGQAAAPVGAAVVPALPVPRHRARTCPARPFHASAPVTVGVEQEFNGLGVQRARAVLAPHLGRVEAVAPTWLGWLGHADVQAKGAAHDHWRTVYDPTLSGWRSFELVSPPLTWEQSTLAARAARVAVDHGATTDAMAALHVHVNHTSLTASDVVQLLRVVDAQQALLLRLSRTSPRQAQYFCRPWDPAFAASLRAYPPVDKAATVAAMWQAMPSHGLAMTYPADAARYHLVNLQRLANGQTLEFRQFDATTDPAAVQAFVDLSVALAGAARDADLAWLTRTPLSASRVDDAALFLDTIGMHGDKVAASRAVLLQYVAHPPRAFEPAQHELAGFARDTLIASLAVLALHGGRRVPAWAEPHVAAQGLAAAARWGALVGEAVGWTGYDTTHATRMFTVSVLPAMHALHVAVTLAKRLERVARPSLR